MPRLTQLLKFPVQKRRAGAKIKSFARSGRWQQKYLLLFSALVSKTLPVWQPSKDKLLETTTEKLATYFSHFLYIAVALLTLSERST